MKLFKINIEFYRKQYNFELPSNQIATFHATFINYETAIIDLYV